MSVFAVSATRRSTTLAAAAAMAAVSGQLLAEDEVVVSTPAQRIVEFSTPSHPPIGANRQEKVAAEALKLRIREGTRLKDVVGRFRQSGDALVFVDAENREFGGLLNLNLERVARMLQSVEEPESVTWSVSGTVTEYSGQNHLLISRAVFRSAAPPPRPENVAE
ncbi:hypothetical protein [Lacipirellula limnantheis]|uniref:Uncharacterized protein n=1 Tax=Lacipirellula limnantheis TaxID=2528024 RepID=A0A517TVG2_9BACT|nr:hypothetical protein [Lacipirellula limnantheis]QDT72363.1 hypothetical protein I41_15370 [Lacipirellula limnantheis]